MQTEKKGVSNRSGKIVSKKMIKKEPLPKECRSYEGRGGKVNIFWGRV